MTEAPSHNSPSLDYYGEMVESTWRKEEYDPNTWRDTYAHLLRGELFELFSQHGTGTIFIGELNKLRTDPEARTRLITEQKRQYDGVMEELGDLLWFSFRTASQMEMNPTRLSAEALSTYSRTSHIFHSFADIEEATRQYADYIQVPSKWALKNPGEASRHMRTLSQSPGYVLSRMVFRLARALDEGRNDVGPFTASMMEPMPELAQSLGDCINIVAYTSKELLDIPTAGVCRRNIEKLQQRSLLGKNAPTN